jgi:protein-S-isoprenylcysteine O-methyltransferase Ste14
MNGPGVRFPPPFIFVLGFLSGLVLERWLYRIPLGSRRPLALAGWTLAVAALALAGWAMITFWRARTAIIPHRPASRLVRHGPYRFTRNPMYVALSALYIGLALLFNVAWPLAMLPAVLWLLWYMVIRHEERYLRAAFGDQYVTFTREVRRWL